jgi:hypothetical protein
MNHGSFPTAAQDIHIHPSDLTHESRILRIARTMERYLEVTPIHLVAIQSPEISEHANQPSKIVNHHSIFDLPAKEAW